MERILAEDYAPPLHSTCIEIQLDKSVQFDTLMKLFDCGSNMEIPYPLKLASEYKCKYIWFNALKHSIEFWGNEIISLESTKGKFIEKIQKANTQFGTFQDRIKFGFEEIQK